MALAGVAGRLKCPAAECIGFIETVGPKIGNLDFVAICARLSDVTALMLGLKVVGGEAGVSLAIGTLTTVVGEFGATGAGFIMTGAGFIMTGAGFIMTSAGFIVTGAGFIMGSMSGIPIAIDSRFLPSSVSKTEINAFGRLRCEVILRRSVF